MFIKKITPSSTTLNIQNEMIAFKTETIIFKYYQKYKFYKM